MDLEFDSTIILRWENSFVLDWVFVCLDWTEGITSKDKLTNDQKDESITLMLIGIESKSLVG
jgi:hypothetical protein